LWQNVLLEWERCNTIDGSGDIPTHLLKPIGKFVFGCLENLKGTQLEKLEVGERAPHKNYEGASGQRREVGAEVHV
jgi:hypothetical protein